MENTLDRDKKYPIKTEIYRLILDQHEKCEKPTDATVPAFCNLERTVGSEEACETHFGYHSLTKENRRDLVSISAVTLPTPPTPTTATVKSRIFS